MTDNQADLAAAYALLERRLKRAEAARGEAESLLERRSRELDRSNRDLRQREQILVAQLDAGNRNLLQAQRLGGIASFFGTEGESFRASESLADIIGQPADRAVTVTDVARVLHPLDRDRIVAVQADVFANAEFGNEYVYEFRIIRPDGSLRWLRWSVSRNLSQDNRSTISGTVQDITVQRAAQRRAEALQLVSQRTLRRLWRSDAMLAQRVIELELSAAALAASHARTEAAYVSKNQFLARMSHKIRTPMNGVLGMMTALAQTRLDPAQERQLQLARAAGDELRILIDEIIDIADAETDHGSTPAPKPVSQVAIDDLPLVVAGRRPRIMVAEDIETNQIVLTSMLEAIGCEHLVVGNGALALAAAQLGGIDAILMDIQMPVMDGAEATRQIRLLDGTAGTVPIIGVTAQAIQSEREALRRAGMNECLAKPITVPLLKQALRAVLAQKPVINAQIFLAAMEALPEGRRARLFDQVARDLTQLADDFAAGTANADAEAVRRARHSLIGVASNFGVERLTVLLAASRDTPHPGADTAAALCAIVETAIVDGRALLTAAVPHNRRATDQ
ncbi:response regulator [Sandarakinorhabdus sp.]|uniref:response regulator n=1 Tax=Sandarakinorhabdus sp. TaxID=1916663 RepID=UPI00334091E8